MTSATNAVHDDQGTAPTPYRLGHVPALDGLRGLAVAAVVGFHGGMPGFGGGFIGVDLFFVLSGFLITRLLLEEHERRKAVSLRRFYARRALRLVPALSVLIAAEALCAWLRREPSPWARIASSLFYYSNWIRATDAFPLGRLSHTWSLSIEEQFYLVWPVSLALVVGVVTRRQLIALTGVAIAAAALWRVMLVTRGVSPERIYNGLDTRIDALLIGAACAMLVEHLLVNRSAWHPVVAGLSACVTVACLFVGDWGAVFWAYGGYALLAMATGAVILYAALNPASSANRVLSLRPLTLAGRLSYSLYLWHYPVFRLVSAELPSAHPYVVVALQFTLACVLAVVSYWVVELPALRLKSRFAA